jgi:uncharacterized coiled-coil DUF342 family protein
VVEQIELPGMPNKRRKDRAWSDLDRIRKRVERLEQRFLEGSASVREMEELPKAKEKLRKLEEEVKVKWKKCFGS